MAVDGFILTISWHVWEVDSSIYTQIDGFLSNTGPNPLKITKLPRQHLMLGHHRHASETPFKWRFAGGSVMARF